MGTRSAADVTVGGGSPVRTASASASAISTRFASSGLKGATFFANASPDRSAECWRTRGDAERERCEIGPASDHAIAAWDASGRGAHQPLGEQQRDV